MKLMRATPVSEAGLHRKLILKYWDAFFLVLLSFGLYFLCRIDTTDIHGFLREENYLRAVLLLLAVGLIANGKELLKENASNACFIFICLGEILFAFWHLNLFAFKKLFIDVAVFFILFYSLPRTRSYKWIGIFGWVIFAVIVLLILPVGNSIFDASDHSYKSSFIHRNTLGYLLVTVFIFISFLRIGVQAKYFLAALYLLLVFMTFSRTTLIASTLVWCWFLLPRRRVKAILLTIAVHCAIVFAWQNELPSYLPGAGGYETREFEGSTVERWQLLQSGLVAYAENPIMGKSELYVTDSDHTKGSHVHNFYLSHLISYGIFPSIAVGLMFYLFFQKSGTRVRLMILNLATFAAFQGFFDTLQSAYFFITILFFYLFNHYDSGAESAELSFVSESKT